MRKILTLALLSVSIMTTSCLPQKDVHVNPFFSEYDTPFQLPPFEQILPTDFSEAFAQGREEHKANIQQIIANDDAPTFENTIEAIEYSSPLLDKVGSVFYNMTSSNTNDELRAIAAELAPIMSAHYDAINMNADLFAKVKAVYDNRANLSLNQEQTMLLDNTYKSFVRSGALLNEEDKAALSAINQELSSLTLQFGENVLAETNAYEMLVENEADLAGLPESLVAKAAAEAEAKGYAGKWLFTTQRSSCDPFLANAENRKLREQLYKAYIMRGDNDNDHDNKDIVIKMANLRLQKANLLGYESHATYVLENNMAKNAANVYAKMNSIMEKSTRVAKQELADMQAIVDAEGGNFKVQAWDWSYYTEKVRKQKFDLNANDLAPYFELNNVVKGAFFTIKSLYGLQITPLNNVPLPHPDAQAFEVKEANGDHVGVLYMDFYARASKKGGAWMSSFRKQEGKDGEFIHPVITTCYNFSKPIEGQSALISFDEATTVFHELGHALHGLLSNCHYNSLSGTSVARDFVELPSQVLEHWVSEPEVMAVYANHYKTGEPMPAELKEKMLNSIKFNQGFMTTEYMGATLLDMDYHSITTPLTIGVREFEAKSNEAMGLLPEITNRYRSTYFSHIFTGGYSAGYYAYIWAAILDSDAFAAFKATGNVFDPETARKFRTNVLQRGGTEEPMKLYKDFRGEEPNEKYLLDDRGLL
ncbi:MAG: M3 family metallopeptidase [Mangrovibacterium sp.]